MNRILIIFHYLISLIKQEKYLIKNGRNVLTRKQMIKLVDLLSKTI